MRIRSLEVSFAIWTCWRVSQCHVLTLSTNSCPTRRLKAHLSVHNCGTAKAVP